MAVRTNFFPLWEMEDGRFRFTSSVDNPKPIQDYLSLVGKFSHFKPEDTAEFQEMVNDRLSMVQALVGASEKKVTK
jgi:pyruvate/2-oxoacid:ferredoxin oxidoreductase beta subunit